MPPGCAGQAGGRVVKYDAPLRIGPLRVLYIGIIALLAPPAQVVSGNRLRWWGLHAPATHRYLEASCDLCEQNWLFILSAGGRTGSTTALSMLNAIPGVELEGEHQGALLNLAALAENLGTTAEHHRDAAWRQHAPDYHATKCMMQQMLRQMLLGRDFSRVVDSVKVLGFKEIRYDTPETLHFLASVFPCARYVLNYRQDVNAEINAVEFQGTAEHPDLRGEWARGVQLFRTFHKHFPNTTAMLPVEDMTVERYNAILHGLIGVKGCTYKAVQHANPSGGYSTVDDMADETAVFEGKCDLSRLNFRLDKHQLAHQRLTWLSLMEGSFKPDHAEAASGIPEEFLVGV